MLRSLYNPENIYEIGVDEAGRGPLFGRLYVAAVIPPKEGFQNPNIKDSKKIKSKKKMQELAEYIQKHSQKWAIHYIEHDVIDKINIRQAVFQGMHESIRDCIKDIDVFNNKTFLLIDGNDFKPFSVYDKESERLMTLPYETIEQGDNQYQAIAAASILAKYARDKYIEELCEEYPALSQRYQLHKNMGYGTKSHLEGIVDHGVTQWHRRSYARCNDAKYNPL
jgi:ribonuclease HII